MIVRKEKGSKQRRKRFPPPRLGFAPRFVVNWHCVMKRKERTRIIIRRAGGDGPAPNPFHSPLLSQLAASSSNTTNTKRKKERRSVERSCRSSLVLLAQTKE